MSRWKRDMAFVKKEFPGAWWNRNRRTIEGYSESLYLGHGYYEQDAWMDAATQIRRLRKRMVKA